MKTPQQLLQLAKAFKQKAAQLPRLIGVEAVNHFQDKFTNGNDHWEGKSWPAPKRKTDGPIRRKRGRGYRKGFSPRDASRHTLVGKGTLSRSLDYKTNSRGVVIYSNVPYAKRHNEGLKGMPQRQFAGMEKALMKKIEKLASDFGF